jgi:hypothetical protein
MMTKYRRFICKCGNDWMTGCRTSIPVKRATMMIKLIQILQIGLNRNVRGPRGSRNDKRRLGLPLGLIEYFQKAPVELRENPDPWGVKADREARAKAATLQAEQVRTES